MVNISLLYLYQKVNQNIMKATEKILKEITKLNEDYKKGKVGTYSSYLKKWKSLDRKFKAARRRENGRLTVSERVRDFGARVKKDGCAGYYIYEGVNFKAKFNEASCENTWWEVDLFSDWAYENLDKKVHHTFEDYNVYDTKNELVSALLAIDEDWNA